MNYKKVLFPVDFSECSPKLTPYAVDIARKCDAKLYLLYVVNTMARFGSMSMGSLPSLRKIDEDLANTAKKHMKAFCQDHLQDFTNYETGVVIGDPSEDILKFAQNEGIDLIVMGTHGRKGLERTVFGSVAERVVRGAPCPVLTINPHKIPKK